MMSGNKNRAQPMACELLRLPEGAAKLAPRIVALHKGTDPGNLAYLQAIRSGAHNVMGKKLEETGAAVNYHAMKHIHASRLANLTSHADAVVSPPSSHPELSKLYRDAIVRKWSCKDLTDRFSRDGSVKSGPGCTLEELTDAISYRPAGDEKALGSIIVVDDIVATGRSIAALLIRLNEVGLRADCSVLVACAWWKYDAAQAKGL